MAKTKPKLVTKNEINLPDGFYKIIDGMAIPQKTRLSNIETKYAFLKTLGVSKAGVGGNMMGQCVQIKDEKIWRSVLNAAVNYGKKNSKTFIGRVMLDGYGVWRIK